MAYNTKPKTAQCSQVADVLRTQTLQARKHSFIVKLTTTLTPPPTTLAAVAIATQLLSATKWIGQAQMVMTAIFSLATMDAFICLTEMRLLTLLNIKICACLIHRLPILALTPNATLMLPQRLMPMERYGPSTLATMAACR
jgi:hypothetical protein